MIQAPVIVKVTGLKASCGQCGREYTARELAKLTLCESCGTDLKQGSVTIETIQFRAEKTGTDREEKKARIEASDLASRISVKRFEIGVEASTKHLAGGPAACHVVSPARAAWVKVA
ncbi:MAG: hypothetical protein Q6373_007435 [Candidatus Sigynarchaeota archaeon]